MKYWKQIRDTGYEISMNGEVQRTRDDAPLKSAADQCGYMRVRLTTPEKRTCEKIHRLVANAFIPNPEGKPCVNHIDGVKSNNFVANLEWCTVGENIRHAEKTGLRDHEYSRGENNYRAVLTWKIVREIRARYKPRCRTNGAEAIARELNVSGTAISLVIHNKSWKEEL